MLKIVLPKDADFALFIRAWSWAMKIRDKEERVVIAIEGFIRRSRTLLIITKNELKPNRQNLKRYGFKI